MTRRRVAYADGFDSPRSPPDEVARAARVAAGDELDLFLGWTPEPRGWLGASDLSGTTVMAGYALADAVASGRLRYVPGRLSAVPRLIAEEFVPDVAVVTGVRRGSDLVFGMSVGWGPAMALAADKVVVEVDERGDDLGAPPIPGNIVATIPRPAAGAPPMPRPPTPVEQTVARHVLSVLPAEPTLQFGPGGVAEAILAHIDRPVRIASGLVTDALDDLERRDVLVGVATAGYVWGGAPVVRVAHAGRLTLLPVETTHDITALSNIERFVACNTALQVGLDGSVNVEQVGGRLVAGIGGHADFCVGASRSRGGRSIVALASTTRSGESTIVARVDCVSTPRTDVEMVVTEHGVADLRGLDDDERARRIIEVAAPAHRAGLTAAAIAHEGSVRSRPQEVP